MDHKPILLDALIAGNRQAISLMVLIILGVIISYIFSVGRDYNGTKSAIKRLFPSASDSFVNRADLLFAVIFGPILAIVLLNPSNYVEALTSGVGWIGTLNTISGSGK
jgi:hypothetical protein